MRCLINGVNQMKSSEAKKLIGKKIQWNANFCPKKGCGTYSGYVTGVKGKNIEINHSDWKWLPDMHNITLVEENT